MTDEVGDDGDPVTDEDGPVAEEEVPVSGLLGVLLLARLDKDDGPVEDNPIVEYPVPDDGGAVEKEDPEAEKIDAVDEDVLVDEETAALLEVPVTGLAGVLLPPPPPGVLPVAEPEGGTEG